MARAERACRSSAERTGGTHGGKAHVVGLSLGAQVAVSLLARSAQLVDKAVISSALFKPMAAAWLYKPTLLGLLFRLSVSPYRCNRRWAQVNMKYSAGIPAEYFPQFFKAFNNMTEEQFVDVTRVGLNNPISIGLSQAGNHTLVLCGEKEYRAMHASTREVAAALPNGVACQVTCPKNVPLREQHNWSMTHPELFTQTVRAWIEGTGLPRELMHL